jgi:hypothetical protein
MYLGQMRSKRRQTVPPQEPIFQEVLTALASLSGKGILKKFPNIQIVPFIFPHYLSGPFQDVSNIFKGLSIRDILVCNLYSES